MAPEQPTYREWQPPPQWRPAVRCCWEHLATADHEPLIVPDGHADLLVHDSGRVEVIGLHDRVDRPLVPASTRIRGIRLRPEAVAAAFRTSGVELRNRTVAVDDVLGTAQASRLHDDRELDRWLRTLEPDPRTAAAVRLLGSHSVLQTADALGITDRHLRRLVLETTGLAPKALQRVYRLQRFLALVPRTSGLAAAAAAAGYADQAHLSRDARDLTGLTPARLVADRRPASAPSGSTSPAAVGDQQRPLRRSVQTAWTVA